MTINQEINEMVGGKSALEKNWRYELNYDEVSLLMGVKIIYFVDVTDSEYLDFGSRAINGLFSWLLGLETEDTSS